MQVKQVAYHREYEIQKTQTIEITPKIRITMSNDLDDVDMTVDLPDDPLKPSELASLMMSNVHTPFACKSQRVIENEEKNTSADLLHPQLTSSDNEKESKHRPYDSFEVVPSQSYLLKSFNHKIEIKDQGQKDN